jgi:type VI secretion system protein ImpH
MAGTTRQPADHLSTASALDTQPTRFALFAALRLIEQLHSSQPRLGESRKAADDPVRLAQPPHLYFAPSDVATYRSEDRARPLLEQLSFGIFGPNGALPLHLTEYAWERMTQADDPTFSDLINTFQHRFISLFYRAWADADPATNQDRPGQDRFETYVGSFLGLGEAAARRRDPVLDHAKLSRCAHFAGQARSAEGLASVLADYFELPIEVRQFIGGWLDIPTDARCRLAGEPDYATLGMGATLGAASWQCQHKFEIVIGPLAFRRFGDFLPGSRGLRELHALVRLYTNDEWSWQVRLLLEQVEVPGMQLGMSGRLGWTTWLGTKNAAADDVLLQGNDLWSLGVAIPGSA